MKQQLTIVVETDDQLEIRNYWHEVVVAKSHTDIIDMEMGNYIYTNQIFTKYIQTLREYSSIAPFGSIRVDTYGTHFWQLPGDVYANDPDIFRATLMFGSLEELEAVRGLTLIKENVPESPGPE